MNRSAFLIADKHRINLGISLAMLVALYAFLYWKLNQGVLSHSAWDSYTLQAQAWWKGKTWLDENFSHLELATYRDKVYVTFPPVPTLVQFVLVPFFGNDTPNNLVCSVYAGLSFILVFLLCWKNGWKPSICLFWSLMTVPGSNLLSISVNGGVWFQAQALNFLLLLLSIYCIGVNSRPAWVFSALAFGMSIGCRPLGILLLPAFLWRIVEHEKARGSGYRFSAPPLLVFLLPMAVVIEILMAYNAMRFGNPLEFGHRYLPEFLAAPHGQFSPDYIPQNLPNLFRLPSLGSGYWPSFPRFDGFAFYIANPFFLLLMVRVFRHRPNPPSILLLGCMAAVVIALLSHKTLGGWQFGTRYLLDIVPLGLWYVLETSPAVGKPEWLVAACAVALQVYGTLWLFLNWP